MARPGYGSASPFLSADVLHSNHAPSFTTTSKFLTIRPHTPSQLLTSLPGSSLNSLTRSRCPTTLGFKAFSISSCSS